MHTVVTEIRNAAPNAQNLIMDYPRLFADDGGCLTPSLNDPETDWLNEMGSLMDGVIGGAVADAHGKGIPVTYMVPADIEGSRVLQHLGQGVQRGRHGQDGR